MSKESLAILAGGLGTRARELANGVHKSLIKLPDGLSIIERLLSQAKSNNIEKAYVVTDRSQRNGVYEEVLGIASQNNIEAISVNQNISQFYGTMFALALICSTVPENENVITFEGDVVISNEAASKIFSSKPNTFIIDDTPKNDCESMKVVVGKGKILKFSKQITGYPEFCGISHLDYSLRKKYNALTKNIKTKNPYYEEVFNHLVELGIELPYLVISESTWNEIDNINDFVETTRKLGTWSGV